MREACDARGIPHDIAMDDASRIYGDAWFDFLGSARSMLSSESGSNAFDFEGNLDQQFKDFATEHGRRRTYDEFKDVVAPLEAPFKVGQISPRVFECAMMRTPMILYRGRYSEAIKAGVHYVPLEKDFSNVDDVLSKLDDIETLRGFADRACACLVASGEFGHKTLARLPEQTIEEQHPIWVDPEWVKYRAATAPDGNPWNNTHPPLRPRRRDSACSRKRRPNCRAASRRPKKGRIDCSRPSRHSAWVASTSVGAVTAP